MAQKVRIELTDDLDGTQATTNVHFTYAGVAYEIDLSDKNVQAFDKAVEKYVQAARKAGRQGTVKPRKAPTGPPAAEVRAWAVAQGIEVPAKGRIPAGIVEKYEALGEGA